MALEAESPIELSRADIEQPCTSLTSPFLDNLRVCRPSWNWPCYWSQERFSLPILCGSTPTSVVKEVLVTVTH